MFDEAVLSSLAEKGIIYIFHGEGCSFEPHFYIYIIIFMLLL